MRTDMREVKSKQIYIVLSQTQTLPSKLIRLYTKETYAHTSIAFDYNLDEMYSFARRGIWNPFNAGFIREDICEGIFGKFTETKCCVYKLDVTESQYKKIREIIDEFRNDSMSYSYNYLGLIRVAFNTAVTYDKRYFCSQFVAYVLKRSGVNIVDKSPALVRPEDIAKYNGLENVYIGKLREYRDYINAYETGIEAV